MIVFSLVFSVDSCYAYKLLTDIQKAESRAGKQTDRQQTGLLLAPAVQCTHSHFSCSF